ncbi:MAG: SDR family NAD(P)-dependent oxidoreductase [Gammaproteobacteria bacterium]|nr:SDR family NAD(P)-dependent oxidoreductase [Gammaproteobacteria bacterium]
MTCIQSFHDRANVVVAGASGGIGSALARALLADPRVGRVAALARSATQIDDARLTEHRVDFSDDASVAAAAAACADEDAIDLVIVATGILHRDRDIRPEKRLADLDAANMSEVLRINTVVPALLAKHLLPRLRRDGKSAFAAISARVGSIGDNRLGGWVSYRASKAALNMAMKTFAIEHTRSHPESLVVTLHPGTTDTALSRPFQRNVPEGKLFTPGFVAERLLTVLDGLSPEDSGGFFAWDGSRIEY